jgi:hypothetical protein
MTEKQSSKTRHQPPPISLLKHKVQRSRSISNGLERQPPVQPARILERRTSITSNAEVIQHIEKPNKVAQLIEQYEKSKSIENIHQSIDNSHSLSSTLALRSANKGKIFKSTDFQLERIGN